MKESYQEMKARISQEEYCRNMRMISQCEATQIASNLKTIEREANKMGVGRTRPEDSAGAAILSIVGYVVIVFILIPLFKYLYKVSSPYLKRVGERALIQYRKHPYAYIFVPAGVIYIIGVIYILMTS